MRWRILPRIGHTAEILGAHRGKRKDKKRSKKKAQVSEVIIIKSWERGIKKRNENIKMIAWHAGETAVWFSPRKVNNE